MDVPPGLESPENKGMVCKIKKSLYGLKQLPRAWFEKLTQVVKRYGFIQGKTDHTMFTKHSHDGRVAIMIVYVHNIIITKDYLEQVKELKLVLGQEFEIEDLG